MKTVTLVGGEGEGAGRRYTTVGGGSGLNRRELFTDARDISSNVGSDDALTDAEYIATNIREGVTILGVEGAMSGSEDMKPQSKEVTPSKEAQTIMPDEEYNCLSQVTVKAIPYVETDNSAGGKTVTIG